MKGVFVSVCDSLDILNLPIILTVMINFQILQLIGEGSLSRVFKARRRQDGKIYALKQMKLTSLSPPERLNCLNEIRMLSKIMHPNIIQYKQAFIDEKCLVMVMELAENGDFLKLMMKRKKQRQPFTEEEVCVYAREMANGLAALHKTNIIHRDVKGANYFISHDGKVKLGDMNVSAIRRNGMAETKIGTPFYTSPEIWLEKAYSTQTDLWSFGCLLYEMVTFCHPFTGRDVAQLKANIIKGQYQPLPQGYSAYIKEIIRGCLMLQPTRRLKANDIISNPYIKKKYNQYRQQTMEKDPMTLRTHTMNCARLLKQISQGNPNLNSINLPSSNYTDKKKMKIDRSVSKRKKKYESTSKTVRPFSQRLITMMQIYNTKKPVVTSRGATIPPKARLIR